MVYTKTEIRYCETCTCELPVRRERRTMIEVLSSAAAFFKVEPDDILSPKRQHQYVRPRYYAMYYLVRAGYTLNDVGKFFNRDHSSVIHARNTVDNMFFTSQEDKAEYYSFTQQLN